MIKIKILLLKLKFIFFMINLEFYEEYFKTEIEKIENLINNNFNIIIIIDNKCNFINKILKIICNKKKLKIKKKKIDLILKISNNFIEKIHLKYENYLILYKNCSNKNFKKIFNNKNLNDLINFININKENNFFIFQFENKNDFKENFNENFLFENKIEIFEFKKNNFNSKINFINKYFQFLNKKLLLKKLEIENFFDFINNNNKIIKIILNSNFSEIQKTIFNSFILFINQSKININEINIEIKKNKNLIEILLSEFERLNSNKKILNSFNFLNIISIPNVNFNEIGGLNKIKTEIKKIFNNNKISNENKKFSNENKKFSIENNNNNKINNKINKKSGIILYGPPGTGKTLIAKAICNEFKYNFLSIKISEILNMFIGESEKNIKKIFDYAKNNSPIVIFFDEIDSLFSNNNNNNILNKIISEFICQIDEINLLNFNIILLGATNRIDLIDKSLFNEGRFDKKFFIDFPNVLEDKIEIFKIHTKNLKLNIKNENEFFNKIFNKNQISGAEIFSLIQKAFIISFKEYKNNNNNNNNNEIIINEEHFYKALNYY